MAKKKKEKAGKCSAKGEKPSPPIQSKGNEKEA